MDSEPQSGPAPFLLCGFGLALELQNTCLPVCSQRKTEAVFLNLQQQSFQIPKAAHAAPVYPTGSQGCSKVSLATPLP